MTEPTITCPNCKAESCWYPDLPRHDNIDTLHRAVRDEARFSDIKDHVCDMWRVFSPYAEPSFRNEFSRHFQERYWELYLGAKLASCGSLSEKGLGKGPDFKVKTQFGLSVYIEATAVAAGPNEDAVPSPPQGDNSEDVPYPLRELFLRITSAVCTKSKQRQGQINNDTCDKALPYVLAVNVGGISGIIVEENPPTLSHVCLGFGGLAYKNHSAYAFPSPHASRKRKPGEQVNTRIFRDTNYSWISGMFLSDVNPFILPRRDHIQFLHNPGADFKLPLGWFPYGSEWHVVDGRLIRYK